MKATTRLLVVICFSQKKCEDFFDTFLPSPSTVSIMLIAAVSLESNLDLFHFDTEQTFLLSQLDADVHIQIPYGCGDLSEKVVLVNASVYGLKQAARSWFELLIATLTSNGFEQCRSDSCVFRLLDSNSGKIKLI